MGQGNPPRGSDPGSEESSLARLFRWLLFCGGGSRRSQTDPSKSTTRPVTSGTRELQTQHHNGLEPPLPQLKGEPQPDKQARHARKASGQERAPVRLSKPVPPLPADAADADGDESITAVEALEKQPASSTQRGESPGVDIEEPLPRRNNEKVDMGSGSVIHGVSADYEESPVFFGTDPAASSHPHAEAEAPQPTRWLLDPAEPHLANRKCLVLDLDETLVHSSFKYISQADFVIPVEIESQYHNVYVIKRPGVDEFMKRVGELYEVVVFTASVNKYGDPLLDMLDIHNAVHHRLFRESCFNYNGNYVKNLAQLGRPINDVIIIDNSPASYMYHPDHAVPISSWFSDIHDNELLDILPFLEDLAKDAVPDVSLVLDVNI